MRIVSPKVHVEVFRPVHVPIPTPSGGETTVKFNPRTQPTLIKYIRSVDIENRRVKGIQFEETALFGGFIEVNIAEDPQSELFDRFIPNDHIEVFYDDVNETESDEKILTTVNTSNDYKFSDRLPKFQGATWKSDLKYQPGMVTTQLFAWDYLRLLQYVNIPRGEQKASRGTEIRKSKEPVKLSAKETKLKYSDDMLDFIDTALDSFVDSHDSVSIFGEQKTTIDLNRRGKTVQGLKFTTSTGNVESRPKTSPILSLYVAGIGEHCHTRLQQHAIYSKFKEVQSEWFTPFRDRLAIGTASPTWSQMGFDKETEVGKITKAISKAIDNMSTFDILQFRFIDGEFVRLLGFDSEGDAEYQVKGKKYTADIIAITQFALIELILKKITIAHGLNQWFTPIMRLDPDFLTEVQEIGKSAGNPLSKLVYIRLREVNDKKEEFTFVNFNMDTYNYSSELISQIVNLSLGNLQRTSTERQSKAAVDIFSEIIASTNFPQPAPDEGDKFSLKLLFEAAISPNTLIKSQKDFFDNLMERFTNNHVISDDPEDSFPTKFYNDIMERTTEYGILMQSALQKDNKLITFIQGVPASYMRADIYTGSKFNTLQYDSLAITRIIQLLASTMAGFPTTNAPVSNTEKGKIDSYPIFAANRIVIRPKAYFGVPVKVADTFSVKYDLYPSLTELYHDIGENKQVDAVCFLILDVAKKKLKASGVPPEFEFPMEDIRDFGMIKAATVNHFFNFSFEEYFDNFKKQIAINQDDVNKDLYDTVSENGIFISYREGGLRSAGFSPPEHQHLRLADLTQSDNYDAWFNRKAGSTNPKFDDKSKPVYNPRQSYENFQFRNGDNVEDNYYYINDFDNFTNFRVKFIGLPSAQGGMHLEFDDGTVVDPNEFTIAPMHGISSYINISDLKIEFAALTLILTGDQTYRDISNVDISLMKNVYIRSPLELKVDLRKTTKYKDKIRISKPPRSAKVYQEKNIYQTVLEINEELQKIDETAMHWLFPYSGFHVEEDGNITSTILDQENENLSDTYIKHLFLVVYLDILIKGLRYILWSLAKARFFCHVYLPIDYQKYRKGVPKTSPDGTPAPRIRDFVVEPGSSVKITYDDESSLFKTIDSPLVAFPIQGLEKGKHMPLYNSISRKRLATPIKNEAGTTVGTTTREPTEQFGSTKEREMTWYVSKKVTYLGADGAMMRVEMTEGSLDWTLFYNEQNLLTQVSEHYLLNGLGNFRSRGIF